MFKRLKQRIAVLEAYAAKLDEDLNSRLNKVENEVNSSDYLNWKAMSQANRETAGNKGHFYLNSKTDVDLLQQVISEINQNEDLAALFTTSDGTTLSLRVSPIPKQLKSVTNRYEGGAE